MKSGVCVGTKEEGGDGRESGVCWVACVEEINIGPNDIPNNVIFW